MIDRNWASLDKDTQEAFEAWDKMDEYEKEVIIRELFEGIVIPKKHENDEWIDDAIEEANERYINNVI